MNCVDFQQIVHDLARESGLEETVRQDALTHADSCARCDELLAQAQSLTSALCALAAKDASAGASQETELALINAFRQKQMRTSRARFTWQWAFAGAAGVAALLLFSVLVLRRSEVRPPTPGTTATTSTVAQPTAPEETNVTQPALGALADSDYASSFVALPFADDALQTGDEVIIRQSVPRSALANFGLPVSEADAGETLVADFVVGEDGIPRAVRIVE